MGPGEAKRRLNRASELEFLIEVSSPTVMRESWKSRKRERENTTADAECEPREHGVPPLQVLRILRVWSHRPQEDFSEHSQRDVTHYGGAPRRGVSTMERR